MPVAARKSSKAAEPPTRFDLDKGAYLYLRSGAAKGRWQLYAYIDGEEVKQSTGTSDLAKAKIKGREMLAEARERSRKGLAARAQYFPDVAELWLAENIGDERDWKAQRLPTEEIKAREGIRKQVRDYLIPYFGQHIGRRSIDQINEAQVLQYQSWRQRQRADWVIERRDLIDRRRREATARWQASARLQKMHPTLDDYLPKDSLGYIRPHVSTAAINKELSILRKIFKFAEARGGVRPGDLPRVKTHSVQDGVARMGFTDAELDIIRKTAKKRYQEAYNEVMARYRQRHPAPADTEAFIESMMSPEWKADRVAWGRYVLMCVIDILAGTGMRPSTLANIKMRMLIRREHDEHGPFYAEYLSVSEFAYSLVGLTHKGVRRGADRARTRTIIPDTMAWKAIQALEAGRGHIPDQPIIDIHPHAINTAFKKVLRACGLEIGPNDQPRSLYDLRHTYITRKLLEGVPQMVVAENTLTSIQMIERYYAHIRVQENFDRLAGGGALQRRRQRPA
ncbi:hypothetical protein WV31_04780 [Magnetospirillum sp. ME-1]|uniref:hypothetical protein n=1 Tax=Magnetospirillum sp. ME-1 TaxID=1639348 RepID=UPI000A17A295|nr:hypothetical protein [Magnetospirillum sp. ME-1]ARJ65026.1 hypothetical protein WV31_04780 [Magnetospirillum sp. ME-1]